MASILIVEDERISAEELGVLVRDAGHEVVGVVNSGGQALAAAEETRPDLALVDVKLRGELDGIAVADRLQNGFDVGVVYVTGHSEESVLLRATRTSAYGYVLKPVDGPTLHASIEMALARRARDQIVTAQKEAERERQRAQRLESLATLAGGIAHGFNNALAIMLTCAARARMAAAGNPLLDGLLTDIGQAGERASGLTAQLTAFAKGGAPMRRNLDLRPLLQSTVALALRDTATRLHFDLDGDLWSVRADQTQLGQAFMNLALNAREAMHDDGTLHVRATNRTVTTSEPGLSSGRFVEVTISDDGPGIRADVIERIFDPFFTTKPSRDGLGLASSYAIVTRHGGTLRAESGSGPGATLVVLLPAAHDEPYPATPRLHESPARRSGRLLVMDDESALRRILALCLTDVGYRVEQAAEGAEAILQFERARESGDPFDAVILDLTIRDGMGGLETLERLKRLDPGVRAIAASGYSDSPVLSDFERYGFRGALAKPFHFTMLVNLLRQVVPSDAEKS